MYKKIEELKTWTVFLIDIFPNFHGSERYRFLREQNVIFHFKPQCSMVAILNSRIQNGHADGRVL